MSQIILDTDKIAKLFERSTDGGIDPEAESAILEVLELQDKINNFVAQMEKEIERKALDDNAFWSGSKGEKINIEYRAYGAIYKAPDIDTVSPEFKVAKFVPEHTDWSLNSKAIESYVLAKKQLPEGVEENQRTKKVTIRKVA